MLHSTAQHTTFDDARFLMCAREIECVDVMPKPTITKDYFTPSYAFISSLLLFAPSSSLSFRFSFGVVSYFEYFFLVFPHTIRCFDALLLLLLYTTFIHEIPSPHKAIRLFVRLVDRTDGRTDCCIPIFIHDFSKAESRYPFLVFTSLKFE